MTKRGKLIDLTDSLQSGDHVEITLEPANNKLIDHAYNANCQRFQNKNAIILI